MSNSPRHVSPAAQLAGLELEDGWVVLERLARPDAATGGAFSHGYLVQNGSRRGFLKALDYGNALQASNPATALEALTRAFNFEKELLEECKKKNLRRVVTPLGDGVVRLPESPFPVQYIIFDLADRDIRHKVITARGIELSWILGVLHQVAVGLRQLHSINVAHQDVKPSNVLVFGPDDTKVGDLGSASREGRESPTDHVWIPGDRVYAPIELLYRHVDPDWRLRRVTTDLYQLGNLCFFLIQGVSLTMQLLERLAYEHHPARWRGTYDDVKGYVSHVHSICLNDLEASVPLSVRRELMPVIEGLTHPEPRRRGHPGTTAVARNKRDLERVVSAFNRLSFRAKLGVRRELP